MKKLLLLAALFGATFSAFAQADDQEATSWTKSIKPVAEADDLAGVRAATAYSGDVYVSTTYNQALSLGNDVTIADPEGLVSSAIIKYNNSGDAQWAITFVGKATVRAMETDADGTLFVAGNILDGVERNDATGAKQSLNSPDNYSAFIAKISTAGKVEALKIITPETDADIAAAVGDPWGDGFDMPLYMAFDPIYVTPNKLQIDGDKIYVSAAYMGDVKELGWEGSYIDMGSYVDNRSNGVFSLNKSDLSNPTNIATVQMTGIIGMFEQYYPEALSFTVENGTIYVGFFGFGNLTLATASDAKSYEFDYGKHPFVLATLKNGSITSTTYDAAPHFKDARPYNIFMSKVQNNIAVGGTYYGELPFDNTKTSGEAATNDEGEVTYGFSSEMFLALLNAQTGEVVSTFVPNKQSVAQSFAYDGGNISALYGDITNLYCENGVYEADALVEGEFPIVAADAFSNVSSVAVRANENEITIEGVYDEKAALAIEAPESKATAADARAYNIAGQPVNAAYKGIVIKGGKKFLQK